MRRCAIALAMLTAAASGAAVASSEIALKASHYYTWGISPADVYIPDGHVITDASLTLYAATSNSDTPAHTLAVYLLDNPPVGWHENQGIAGVDHLAPHGCRIKPDYVDRIPGRETVSYRLAAIDHPDSWAWRIYNRPFVLALGQAASVAFSSTILELMDYVGNSTPFGIGLDPGGGDFALGGMSLVLTIEAYDGPPEKSQLHFVFGNTNSPPLLQAPTLRVASEGMPLTVTFTAGDPDGDDVQLSCSTLPAGASFEGGVFSWTPPYETTSRGVAMPTAVTVTASDGVLWTSRTCMVWVFNTNRAPLLMSLIHLSTDKTKLIYYVMAIDPDGDPLTYRATKLPRGATFDPVTRIICWETAGLALDVYEVEIEVSDGLLASARTFPVVIERSALAERQEGLISR